MASERVVAKNPNAQLPTMARVPAHVLRSNGPRYLEDGSELPLGEISSRRNRSDKHHVFPRALLRRNGIEADRANSILNICYLVARENQSIGQRAPRKYLEEVPKSLRSRNTALRSHLLPIGTDSGLWDSSIKRGFKRFREEREAILKKAFERQAGVALFERR